MRSFVQVVDAGGFTAAERAGGTPFRLSSKHVRRLEESLGVALLERSTRSVRPTAEGRAYLAYCREIMALLDEARADVRREADAVAGTLRVAFAPGYAATRGHALVAGFLAQHPQVEVEIETSSTMVDLIEARIDVALRLTKPADSSLIARRIVDAPLAVVATPACVARWGAPADPIALAERPCIVDLQHRFRDRWPIDGGHVAVSGRVRVRGALSALWFATRDHGFALVPRMVVTAALESGELVEVLPGAIRSGWSLWAVTTRSRMLTARTRAFLSHVRAVHAS